jgi:hypothetical protein
MKPVLCLAATAALALTTVPAAGQDAPSPAPADSGTPPNFLSFANDPYRLPDDTQYQRWCFNGRSLAGVNRAGDRTLYVQVRTGGIYRVELAEGCEALASAHALTMNPRRAVCTGERAVIALKTPAGPKTCRASDVRRLTRTEVATLAASAQR